jgi:nitrite reductase (NADH) large subunit
MKNYLIIGHGAAGAEAAVTIRKQDPDSRVTILTEDAWLPYFRPRLVHFLAETGAPDGLLVHDQAWYDANGISVRTGTRAASLDTAARTVTTADGAFHPYDRLLLATGSLPFVPPLPGRGRPGVFTLRTIADSLAIKDHLKCCRKILVIGGGLLGLESAYALAKTGIEATVVESAPWLLPRQLDAAGGRHLQGLLEAQGMRFILGDQAESIAGTGDQGPVSGVRLKSGALADAQAVLFSIGVRPDTAWLAGSGLTLNRGIVVDDHLACSAPDVWAAGDAAEHRGVCQGLWMSAKEQGRIAALNMTGTATAYQPAPPVSQLKITGIDVFSSVSFDTAILGKDGRSGPAELSVQAGSDPESYRKLVMGRDGQVEGIMVIGDKAGIQTARKVLAGSARPEEFLPAG